MHLVDVRDCVGLCGTAAWAGDEVVFTSVVIS